MLQLRAAGVCICQIQFSVQGWIRGKSITVWAWLRRVAVVLNHLAPGTVPHSPLAKRVTGTDKLVGKFTKQECHHTTMTWLHCWLLPYGCWLHAASCQLDALQWSHWNCQKLQAFFPIRHSGSSWLTAQSIPNSLRSLRPCLWPSDTGHSWRHLVTEFIQELGKTLQSHLLFQPPEHREQNPWKTKIWRKMVWKWDSRYNRWSSQEGCCATWQKTWHASARSCVNKGLTHHFSTQISYYNRANTTQPKQRDHFAMLSDLLPTLKINEVNKMFYTDIRQHLSANKCSCFWKIFLGCYSGKYSKCLETHSDFTIYTLCFCCVPFICSISL